MIDRKLGTALRSLVRRYGFKEVDRSLREIRLSEPRLDGAPHSRRADSVQTTKKKRHTVSAQEYVAKMDHDPEKRPAVSELAKRFEEKTFLPTIGDIRNFCQVYGIDEPASKSRRSAIPRVFKCMATMSAEEVRGILDDGMFSGPSRWGLLRTRSASEGGMSPRAASLYIGQGGFGLINSLAACYRRVDRGRSNSWSSSVQEVRAGGR